jgi:hypothetical protein
VLQALPLFVIHQLTPLSGDNLHGGRGITCRQHAAALPPRTRLSKPFAGFDMQRPNTAGCAAALVAEQEF